MDDDLDLGDAAFFHVEDLEGEILVFNLLVQLGEVTLDLQQQAGQGVCIALCLLEDIVIELQYLIEVAEQRLTLEDKGVGIDDEKNYVRINANTFIFEGKTLLSDFYKIMKVDDDIFEDVEGDADTIAGLLLEIKGDFPKLHEKIEYKNFTFEILEMEERRISKVKVVIGREQ